MEQAFKYIFFETQRHFVHFLWSGLNMTKSEHKIR